MIKKVSILLILFIFGIIAPGWADEVKSIHNMTNQEIRNKVGESKESCPVRPIPAYKAGLYGLTEDRQLSNANTKPAFIPVHRTGFSACLNKKPMREKKGPAKTPTQLSEKNQNRSLTDIPYIDYGARVRRTTLKINFLKAVEEKKEIPLTECLDRVVSSYDFAQHVWKDKLFNFMGTAEAHLSKPEQSQSILGSPSTGNKYFDEGRALDKFKPFKPKREESFKAIFMEFRLTYNPVSQRVFIKMNVTPSENEPGFIIPFK